MKKQISEIFLLILLFISFLLSFLIGVNGFPLLLLGIPYIVFSVFLGFSKSDKSRLYLLFSIAGYVLSLITSNAVFSAVCFILLALIVFYLKKDRNKLNLFIYLIMLFFYSGILTVYYFGISLVVSRGIFPDDIIPEVFLMTIFSLISLIAPVSLTIGAMVKKWSKYLDWFFNRAILPFVIFIICIALCFRNITGIIAFGLNLSVDSFESFCAVICFCYLTIYPIIAINNIIRAYKKIKSKS